MIVFTAIIIFLLAVFIHGPNNLFSSVVATQNEFALSTKDDHLLAAQIGYEKKFTNKMKNLFQEMNTASRGKDLKNLSSITNKVISYHMAPVEVICTVVDSQ